MNNFIQHVKQIEIFINDQLVQFFLLDVINRFYVVYYKVPLFAHLNFQCLFHRSGHGVAKAVRKMFSLPQRSTSNNQSIVSQRGQMSLGLCKKNVLHCLYFFHLKNIKGPCYCFRKRLLGMQDNFVEF